MLRYCRYCAREVESAGHTHAEKPCDVCHIIKKIDQFLPHPTSIDKYQRTCKTCVEEENRKAAEQYQRRLLEKQERERLERERLERERLEQERLAQKQERETATLIEPCGLQPRAGWEHASHQKITYPEDTERSGKWLIFSECEHITGLWNNVKRLLYASQLGRAAKVSLVGHIDQKTDKNVHVICVYTYDYADRSDVFRIRQALRDIGVTWKISYKADEATRQGIYSINAARGTHPPGARKTTRVSIYYA